MEALEAQMRRGLAGFLGLARRRGFLAPIAVVVPLASMVTVLATVAVCLYLWRAGPSYQAGVVFPAISELGVDPPQQRLYQLGFAACGGLLALGILLFEELLPRHLLPLEAGVAVQLEGLRGAPELNGRKGQCKGAADAGTGRVQVQLQGGEVKAVKPANLAAQVSGSRGADAELLQTLLWWGHMSALGVVVQGVFTLERDISAQCFVHWGGAVLFMVGAMRHGKASNDLYDKAVARGSDELLKGKAVTMALKVRHFILDYSNGIMFAVPILMQMMPAATGAGSVEGGSNASNASNASAVAENKTAEGKVELDPSTANTMGVMQWGIILQFALYFCSYTLDLGAAARRASLREV